MQCRPDSVLAEIGSLDNVLWTTASKVVRPGMAARAAEIADLSQNMIPVADESWNQSHATSGLYPH